VLQKKTLNVSNDLQRGLKITAKYEICKIGMLDTKLILNITIIIRGTNQSS